MNNGNVGSAGWIAPDWPTAPTVHSFITTRFGGVSSGPYASFNVGNYVGDDPQAVSENRKRLRGYLPNEPIYLQQIHGNQVFNADVSHSGVPEADASVTTTRGVPLVIQTADCLPILICDQAGTVVGAVHAGWRGLCADVIENTVQLMKKSGEDLFAYLGPAIGPNNFEVGSDVRDAFLAKDIRATDHFREKDNGKWLADLYGLARQRLAALGIIHIHGGNFCTFAEKERFFSYRRDRTTGRMASVIWLS